jgi:hypothetical protein
MAKEIITAEEYLEDDAEIALYKLREDHPNLFKLLTKKLIGFASIHCEAQEIAILDSAYVTTNRDKYRTITSAKVNRESIVTAYPLTNIK